MRVSTNLLFADLDILFKPTFSTSSLGAPVDAPVEEREEIGLEVVVVRIFPFEAAAIAAAGAVGAEIELLSNKSLSAVFTTQSWRARARHRRGNCRSYSRVAFRCDRLP